MNSILTLNVYDKDQFKEDDFIGKGDLDLASLTRHTATYQNLSIPINVKSDSANLFSNILNPSNLKRVGSVDIDLHYISFRSNVKELLLDGDQSTSTTYENKLPVGATVGCDWKSLLSEIIKSHTVTVDKIFPDKVESELDMHSQLKESMRSGLHQICYIENEDSHTQVLVWADVSKRVVNIMQSND